LFYFSSGTAFNRFGKSKWRLDFFSLLDRKSSFSPDWKRRDQLVITSVAFGCVYTNSKNRFNFLIPERPGLPDGIGILKPNITIQFWNIWEGLWNDHCFLNIYVMYYVHSMFL
jgi:hypothetical protein